MKKLDNWFKKGGGGYLQWIRLKDPQDRIELRRMQGKIRKMIAEAKDKSWEKTCSTVESYLGGKRSTVAWGILRNLRKNENGGQWFNPIPTGKWETYFKELLTENWERYVGEQHSELGDMKGTGMDKIKLDINVVKMAIKSLKSKTSSGVGGVPAELLKSGTDKVYESLRQIFERCINGEGIPQDWKMGYISAIHKKGKKDEYDNYRGITVLNIFSRLYGKMIKYYLDQEFAQIETEEQAGFRAGRSTIDHIFYLKQLRKKWL
jgi:transcriptional regulator CtsR